MISGYDYDYDYICIYVYIYIYIYIGQLPWLRLFRHSSGQAAGSAPTDDVASLLIALARASPPGPLSMPLLCPPRL